jgi:hypothetical protein
MSGHAKAAALREKATSCAEKFQARPIYLRDPIVTVYDKGTVMQDASPLCALIDYKK